MHNLLALFAFLPWLFGYGSKLEAEAACKEWEAAGVTHRYVITIKYDRLYTWKRSPYLKLPKTRKTSIDSRRCQLENETKRFLGLESPTIRDAASWDQKRQFTDDFKVVERFRF